MMLPTWDVDGRLPCSEGSFKKKKGNIALHTQSRGLAILSPARVPGLLEPRVSDSCHGTFAVVPVVRSRVAQQSCNSGRFANACHV